MHDWPTQETERRGQAAAGTARRVPSSSSSRMFASYLVDVEQLLDAQRRDAALREALDLPRIAVALADPQLRCTGEQARTWCQEWIRPPGAEQDAQGLEYELLSAAIAERVAQLAASETVPMRALRRLQLRRHARTSPRGFAARRAQGLPAREVEAIEMSTALFEAARRWYARSACRDPIVQANLARLAVLR